MTAFLDRIMGSAARDRDFRAFLWYTCLYPVPVLRQFLKNRPSPTGRYPVPVDGTVVPSGEFQLPLSWDEQGTPVEDPINLRLASQMISVTASSVPWNYPFQDIEDTASLHRFAWLLPLLLKWKASGASSCSAWGKVRSLIMNWTAHHPAVSASEAWQPYTVSERLVNWIFAAMACGSVGEFRSEFGSVMAAQCEHLLANLEDNGPIFTGNHLANNGRALYIAGLLLGNSFLYGNGRQILLDEIPRLFPGGFFLREGSSHYQLLVTRNYVECLWLAQHHGDGTAVSVLTSVVRRLLEGCRFFRVADADANVTIPLVGDISPDCSPEWLRGVLEVGSSIVEEGSVPVLSGEGWHSFFAKGCGVAGTGLPSFVDHLRLIPSKEWGRIDYSQWTVFTHVNPAGHPIAAGHAHHDTGSLCVFWAGYPLIIDCGRKRYSDDEEGGRGKGYLAHSIAILDEENPAPSYLRFYPDDFLHRRVGDVPVLSVFSCSFQIIHGGFSRIGGGTCVRRVTADTDALTIEDTFLGSGRHKVTLLFHFPHRVRMDGNVAGIDPGFRERGFSLILPSDLQEHRVYSGKDRDFRFGWASREYGDEYAVSTVVARGTVTLPWSGISILKES